MRGPNYVDNNQLLRDVHIQNLRLNIIIGLFIFTLLPNFEYGASALQSWCRRNMILLNSKINLVNLNTALAANNNGHGKKWVNFRIQILRLMRVYLAVKCPVLSISSPWYPGVQWVFMFYFDKIIKYISAGTLLSLFLSCRR